MPRDGAVFECTACGQQTRKWLGRCPTCGGWNTIEQAPDIARPRHEGPAPEPVPLTQADLADFPRLSAGIPGVNRVLGGGFVDGSVALVAGEPGVGKSTLLLQIAARIAPAGRVLYVSAEESARQIVLRARRLSCMHDNVLLLPEPVVEAAVASARSAKPVLVIVDSVQTMLSERVPSIAGSVTQVREVAGQLVEFAKRGGPAVVLVGHITKDGLVAGPKSLEHLVDVVLDFGGATTQSHRTLRATKNRFGPALELALFSMGDAGLEEVTNPSAALLEDRVAGAAGSAVAVVMEGTRPLLVEVQALVSRSNLANPRRVTQGVDSGRVALLLAVLEKRAGVRLADRDVFVNLIGGLDVEEPALDLAIAAAIVSSVEDRALPHNLVMFGEIGLLGEVRAVSRADERVREAESLGYLRCAVPASTRLASPGGVAPVTLENVSQLRNLFASVD